MADLPYIIASCAISVDGCLDDASPQRLILSNAADLDEVDELRASVDAIMVGAGTIRGDDPRLLIRSPDRVARRVAAGLPPHPLRVTLTSSEAALSPAARFFTGPGEHVDYAGPGLTLPGVLADLRATHGVARLLVEGGAQLLSAVLAGGLADELRVAIAPFFVGDPAAPRFALPGRYPHGPAHPMTLRSARRLGEVTVVHYRLGGAAAGDGGSQAAGLVAGLGTGGRAQGGRAQGGPVQARAGRPRPRPL